MNTIVVEDLTVQVPEWIRDLESFRRWACSDEFPDELGNPEFTLSVR